jgi:hypothetical protein
MRRKADGDEYTPPATIDDPATLDEMRDALRVIGLRAASSCADAQLNALVTFVPRHEKGPRSRAFSSSGGRI